MLPIWSEPKWLDLLFFASIPIVPVIIGYVLLRRSRSTAWRRIGALIVAAISGFVGTVAMLAYAIPALDDLHRSGDLAMALVGNLFIWSICLGALVISFRCIWSAFRTSKPTPRT